jgi:uncharacterized protein with HEPN domain
MISYESARYLWDAKTAADDILQFVAGRGLDHYLDDKMLRSAVERQFTIIGEALVGLRRIAPDLATEIADLQRIVAFRNVLIHDYGAVDDGLVWKMIENNLPDLRATIERLLRDAPQP